MRRLDFFKLTRSVQDQLLWAFRGEFQVSPILFQKATRPRPWIWLAVSAAAAAALVALALVGMGDLDAAAARQPLPVIVVYVLLVGLVALGIVQALAYISSLKPLPFPTGYYLLPTNVLDARDRNIAVYPLEEVTGVAPRGSSGVEVAFVGKRFLFRVEPASLGDAVAQVEAARERVRAGLEPADRRLLDPLEQPVVASTLASEVPLYTKPPAWVVLRLGSAA